MGKKEARKQRGIELILGIEAKEESGLDKEFVIVAMEGTERNRASEDGWDFGFCRDGDAAKGREGIWDEISVTKRSYPPPVGFVVQNGPHE